VSKDHVNQADLTELARCAAVLARRIAPLRKVSLPPKGPSPCQDGDSQLDCARHLRAAAVLGLRDASRDGR
jgi:hypothetical protein